MNIVPPTFCCIGQILKQHFYLKCCQAPVVFIFRLKEWTEAVKSDTALVSYLLLLVHVVVGKCGQS